MPNTQLDLATSAGKRMRGNKHRHSECKIISNNPRLPARPGLQVYNAASKLHSNLIVYSKSSDRNASVLYMKTDITHYERQEFHKFISFNMCINIKNSQDNCRTNTFKTGVSLQHSNEDTLKRLDNSHSKQPKYVATFLRYMLPPCIVIF
jgi:hypothetical protein